MFPSEKMTLFKWESAGTTALCSHRQEVRVHRKLEGVPKEGPERDTPVTPRFCARKRARITKREVSPEEQCVLTSVRLTCSTELMYVGVYPIRM